MSGARRVAEKGRRSQRDSAAAVRHGPVERAAVEAWPVARRSAVARPLPRQCPPPPVTNCGGPEAVRDTSSRDTLSPLPASPLEMLRLCITSARPAVAQRMARGPAGVLAFAAGPGGRPLCGLPRNTPAIRLKAAAEELEELAPKEVRIPAAAGL